MLFLTRKIGQSIIIENDIELTVIDVRGKTVKIGFDYPKTAQILRKEVYDRIQEENRQAAQNSTGIEEALTNIKKISMPKTAKVQDKKTSSS